MVTLDQARSQFIAAVDNTLQHKNVSLDAALQRVLAEDIVAEINVPPQDNSAMDGFAVNSKDLSASETELKITQRIPAGSQGALLAPGTAARIFTGGEIPAGADAVVIQENCEYDQTVVKVLTPVNTGDNIRPRGQDISLGSTVVVQGKCLTAIDLGLIAAVGKAKLCVYKRIRVAIMSTGNELIDPGQPLQKGQIYNSNRAMLIALCQQLGYQTIDCGVVRDTLAATKDALRHAAERADVILSTGGVSVGEEDYIKLAIEKLGRIQQWKVQMKPGKPVVLGSIKSENSATPILALPGNPVSSFITFQLLGLPLMRKLQGQNQSKPVVFRVEATFSKACVTREEYIRVRLDRSDANSIKAGLFDNQSSGVLSSLSWADGLVRQVIGSEIKKGQSVEFLPMANGLLL